MTLYDNHFCITLLQCFSSRCNESWLIWSKAVLVLSLVWSSCQLLILCASEYSCFFIWLAKFFQFLNHPIVSALSCFPKSLRRQSLYWVNTEAMIAVSFPHLSLPFPPFGLVLFKQFYTFLDGWTHLAIVQDHQIIAKWWWYYWSGVICLHYEHMLLSHMDADCPQKKVTWHDMSQDILYWVNMGKLGHFLKINLQHNFWLWTKCLCPSYDTILNSLRSILYYVEEQNKETRNTGWMTKNTLTQNQNFLALLVKWDTIYW